MFNKLFATLVVAVVISACGGSRIVVGDGTGGGADGGNGGCTSNCGSGNDGGNNGECPLGQHRDANNVCVVNDDGGNNGGAGTFTVHVDGPGNTQFDQIIFHYDLVYECEFENGGSRSTLCEVDLASADDTRTNTNTADFTATVPSDALGFRYSVTYHENGQTDHFSYENFSNPTTVGTITVRCNNQAVAPFITPVRWSGGPGVDAFVTLNDTCENHADTVLDRGGLDCRD
jgi:hypothetical protein